MNTRSISVCALLITSGCRESDLPVTKEVLVAKEVKASPKVRLERLIEESGEVTFFGWSGRKHNEGAHFRLTFQKESKVKLDTLGYNFVFAYGSFRLKDDSLIDIAFDQIDAPSADKPGYAADWPLLRLTESGGHLMIHREDGKTAWHMDWPLYPQVTGDLWPISASAKSAE